MATFLSTDQTARTLRRNLGQPPEGPLPALHQVPDQWPLFYAKTDVQQFIAGAKATVEAALSSQGPVKEDAEAQRPLILVLMPQA